MEMISKKEAAAHICNLISMAIRDNEFHEEEKLAVIRIASRFTLGYSEFLEIIQQGELEFKVPDNLADRIQQLHDLVQIMLADGKVRDEELKFLSFFLKGYGFEDQMADNHSVEIDLGTLQNHASFDSFMHTFGNLTAEKLSSVVVDHEFRIRFPLYDAELRNIGPLPKTLYIFFLLQDKDVKDLSSDEYKHKMSQIYRKIPYSDFNVDEKIDSLTNPDGYYSCNKNTIRNAIMAILPNNTPELLNQYIIHGGLLTQPKRILLDKNLIKVQPKFF